MRALDAPAAASPRTRWRSPEETLLVPGMAQDDLVVVLGDAA
jgi:hypothetical protein